MFKRFNAVVLAAVAAAAFAVAGVAEACSCVRFGSAAEQYAKSDAVFEGRVVRIDRTGPERSATTFEVLDRLKGKMGRRIRVDHHSGSSASCGIQFKRGQIVTVTAQRTRNGWTTSMCAKPQFEWREFRQAAGRTR